MIGYREAPWRLSKTFRPVPCRLAILLLGLIALTPCPGAAQQTPQSSVPPLIITHEGTQVRIDPADPNAFNKLRSLPRTLDAPIVEWLSANARQLIPIYVAEMARRLFPTDREKSITWFHLGFLRMQYDARRCADRTAASGLFAYGMIAPEIVDYFQKDTDVWIRTGKKAAEWEKEWPADSNPMWVCRHGMSSYLDAMRGQPSRTSPMVPRAEWATIRENIRKSFVDHLEELSKPDLDEMPVKELFGAPVEAPVELSSHIYYWFDDNSLLFNSQTSRGKPATVYKWTVGGHTDPFDSRGGYYCSAGGFYRVVVEHRQDKDRRMSIIRYLYGPYPNLTPHELEDPFDIRKGYKPSQFDCSYVRNPGKSGVFVPLKRDHGAVDYVQDDPAGPAMMLFRPNGEQIRLPITEKLNNCISFSELSGTYLLWRCEAPRQTEQRQTDRKCTSFWRLWHDGKVKEECLPQTNKVFRLVETKAGLILVSTHRESPRGLVPDGVYLIQDSHLIKIYSGKAAYPSVSRDGCRLAFVETAAPPKSTYKLKVLDMCAPQKTVR
jgi:hypothetical protein